MNQVLYALCRHCVGIMDGWRPYPAWAVAQQAGVSLYVARKELRRLKQEGVVDTICEKPSAEDCENTLPYHGWTITRKAYDSEEYIAAANKEADICAECFGSTKEEYLRAFLGRDEKKHMLRKVEQVLSKDSTKEGSV